MVNSVAVCGTVTTPAVRSSVANAWLFTLSDRTVPTNTGGRANDVVWTCFVTDVHWARFGSHVVEASNLFVHGEVTSSHGNFALWASDILCVNVVDPDTDGPASKRVRED
jgi:hypothetical protein